MITFQWCAFDELSLRDVYHILALRSAVFVLGQQCIYQDADGKDFEAQHLIGKENGEMVAYLRLYANPLAPDELKFGRVLTKDTVRGKGYGKLMMTELMAYCRKKFKSKIITCSAQLYLQKFYESYGFVTASTPYEEENMPHIAMRKDPD